MGGGYRGGEGGWIGRGGGVEWGWRGRIGIGRVRVEEFCIKVSSIPALSPPYPGLMRSLLGKNQDQMTDRGKKKH